MKGLPVDFDTPCPVCGRLMPKNNKFCCVACAERQEELEEEMEEQQQDKHGFVEVAE